MNQFETRQEIARIDAAYRKQFGDDETRKREKFLFEHLPLLVGVFALAIGGLILAMILFKTPVMWW